MKNYAIVIPAYRPMDALPGYVAELLHHEIKVVIVINDGSEFNYQPIFEQMKKMKKVTVIEHDINQGKGASLKIGFLHILKHFPEVSGVVTADADGQHLISDVLKVGTHLDKLRDGFVLGTREFKLNKVPFRSWFGNTLTSRVFQFFFGTYIRDTQTGLRGITTSELDWLTQLKGERFEYEMNMLINMFKKNKPVIRVDIETVYGDLHTSQYSTYKDSVRIIRVFTKNYFKMV